MGSAEESSLFMPGKGANSDASKNSQGLEEILRNFQVPSDNTREMTLQESSSLGDLVSGKLKLMCSFGGKILPRPSDGKLRYVGGQTRLISVHTAVRFSDLMEKIRTSYGQALIMKYQLPDEDLDSLVSVTCDEDLHNMIEEYGRMTSGNDGVRIRLFLSSIGDQEYFDLMNDKQNSHQQYVDAINDAVETGLKISTEQPGVKSGVNEFLTSPMFSDLANSTFQPVSIASSSGRSLAQEAAPTYLPGGGMSQYSNQSATQDAIYPPGMQVNISPSSKQATVSVSALVMQNAISDASMNFFEKAPNLGAQSYILRPMEGQQGKDAGGIVNSLYPHNSHYGLPEAVTTAEMSFQTTSAFTLPLDKQLLDSNFSRGDQYDQHIQLQNQQDMSQNPTENRFDVRQGKDLHAISSLPSSSGPQSTWQTGHESWNLHQSRQNQPSLLHVNGQQLAGVDLQNFIQTTQGQMLPPNFLNGASLQKTISNQQTGHYLSVSDQAQGMVQFPGTLQTMCIQDPFSNERIHGTTMFNFNDSSIYVPSVSTADYYSNVSSDNVATQPAFSNDHNYGMQQVLSTEKPSHPNEVYHQPSSEIAFSEAISNVHTTTYEIPVQTDGSILSIPPYTGLNTLQDGMPSFTNFQNIDGHKVVGNQQAKETEVNSSGMQHYSMSTVSAEYAPQKQVVYPYYPENISMIGELDPKRQMEQDAISRQYLIDPKLSEPGSLNQHASHLVLNDHILQPKENYSGSSARDFVDFSKQLDAKTMQPEFGNVAPDTFKASDLPRQVQDVGPLNHGGTVLEARKLNPQQPLNNQLEGGVTAYSHSFSNTVANSMLNTGPSQGNLIEGIKSDDSCHAGMEKNTSGENNILRGVYNNTSSPQSYGSGVNQPEIISDGYSQPSITAPKFTSNASADGRKSPSAIAATEMSFNISDLSSLKDLSTELPTSGTLQNAMAACSSAPYTFESGQIGGEHLKAESHDFNHTGQGAFQSPLQSSLPMSNGNKHEGTETDNFIHEEESTFDNFDNDNTVTDAFIAEGEAVARGLQVIKNADLEELQELGSGTFGTVYHGKWRGTDVAIKRIKNSCFTGRPSQQENMRADFWSEATLLAKLHHPNILAFYGVVPDGPGGTLGTVTEYMVNGSLKHVLQRKDRPVDYRKRVLIAMDAAFGMEYLHSKNIVHFDLKCENLLVNMRDPQRPICKVGDFGLSKIKHQTLVSGGVRGTLPWIAPELLNGSSHMVSEKVDVYSFGIVLWELLTGEEPYANMHYGAIIGGIVSNTLRPSVPDYCDPAWQALMEHCWFSDPSGRPTFTEIVSKLRAIAASLQSKGVQKQA